MVLQSNSEYAIAPRGPLKERFFYCYSNSMGFFSVAPFYGTIPLQNFAHATLARVSCHVQNFLWFHKPTTWVVAEWNLHRIWGTMEKSFAKLATDLHLHPNRPHPSTYAFHIVQYNSHGSTQLVQLVWWLLMAWHPISVKTYATTMMTKADRCVLGGLWWSNLILQSH